jgi:glycosyltransferase involved in cell wall biosynthesis
VRATIIIPIYNEAESLPTFLHLLGEIEEESIEFLIVDNGSTDQVVKDLLQSASGPWKSIRTENNLGFGGGILFGAANVKTDYVGWMPGNLKVDPRDVGKLFRDDRFEDIEFLKARRVGRGLLPQAKTFFAGLVQSIILRKRMFDSGGTPTICRKKFLLDLVNPPQDYVFESFVFYQAKRSHLKVIRPKFFYGKRLHGHSHWQRGFRSEVNLMKRIWVSARSWK